MMARMRIVGCNGVSNPARLVKKIGLYGLLAQGLLRGLQYWLLLFNEWRRSFGTLIRRVVHCLAVLRCPSRLETINRAIYYTTKCRYFSL